MSTKTRNCRQKYRNYRRNVRNCRCHPFETIGKTYEVWAIPPKLSATVLKMLGTIAYNSGRVGGRSEGIGEASGSVCNASECIGESISHKYPLYLPNYRREYHRQFRKCRQHLRGVDDMCGATVVTFLTRGDHSLNVLDVSATPLEVLPIVSEVSADWSTNVTLWHEGDTMPCDSNRQGAGHGAFYFCVSFFPVNWTCSVRDQCFVSPKLTACVGPTHTHTSHKACQILLYIAAEP